MCVISNRTSQIDLKLTYVYLPVFAVSVASSASSVGTSFPSPGSAPSSLGSYSLHRRWKRSFDTSLEHNFQKRQSEENMMVLFFATENF